MIFLQRDDSSMSQPTKVAGLDVQYEDSVAYIAMVFFEYPDISKPKAVYLLKKNTPSAYEPGSFAKREAPLLIEMINSCPEKPDILFIDGHGKAHFNKAGMACTVGAAVGIPTVGIAKESLLPYNSTNVNKNKGSFFPIQLEKEEEVLGYGLYTAEGAKPMFCSVGYDLHLEVVKELCLQWSVYRIPEPIRFADFWARKYSKGEALSELCKFV